MIRVEKGTSSRVGLLTLSALVLIGIGAYYYARSAAPPPATTRLLPAGVTLELTRVRFFEFEGPRLARELAGTSVIYSAQEPNLRFIRPEVRLFQADGQELSASCREAYYLIPDSRIEMHGRVKAQNQEGIILETEELVYHEADQQLESPGPVKVWGRGASLEGRRLRANLATQEILVEGPVRLRAEELKWAGR